MRATAAMTNAIATAISHLEANGAKYIERGKSVHGGCRLTSWRDCFLECRNLTELQFHFDLFCAEIGCSTLQLNLSLSHLADRGLVQGTLPMNDV